MGERVALVSCESYGRSIVGAAVHRALDLLGGMERFVRSGQRVLVKPNLLQPVPPERAVTTHPEVVRAVVGLVQEAGGDVLIADNPVTPPLSARALRKLYERCGLAEVAAETGAELYMRTDARQRSHPAGDLMKLIDTSGFLDDVDLVISLPKLKTHSFMRYTGAVKNLFGTVPGATKFGYHARLRTPERFADMLLDLVSYVRPTLTVMDAVVGMDGDGPAAGDPFPIGAILAGANPLAVDVAALGLLGCEPGSVQTVARAVRRGWISGRVEDLDLLGEDLAAMRVDGFRVPAGGGSQMERLPDFLKGFAIRQMVSSPQVTDQCVGCGDCIANCPVETIDEVGGRAKIRLDGCIRCYCCHEMCPEQAIALSRPLVGHLLATFGR
jgi:uncharacterized protein (DUF362 family)/Pyruvate/2-oxoacid:ferredoxin oxidoreductase delta subunit